MPERVFRLGCQCICGLGFLNRIVHQSSAAVPGNTCVRLPAAVPAGPAASPSTYIIPPVVGKPGEILYQVPSRCGFLGGSGLEGPVGPVGPPAPSNCPAEAKPSSVAL